MFSTIASAATMQSGNQTMTSKNMASGTTNMTSGNVGSGMTTTKNITK
ncbi:MAG TPA: hypothetical protein VIW25_11190 [Nitrososphaeraceae archaeon]